MDPLEDNTATSTSSSRSFFVFAAIVIVLQILVSVISYPFLPDLIPSHWNADGRI